MDELRVGSFKEFHDLISLHHDEWFRWYYRGHTSTAYKLVPKVGRPPFAGRIDDRMMFARWRRHAVAYVEPGPSQLSEWDWLAIAQHHGLATRLLDWSFNAMTAAFFALIDGSNRVDESRDSAVYAHYSRREFVDTKTETDPFALRGIHRVAPGSVVPRIGRQGGIFTLHGPPDQGLEELLPAGDALHCLIIDRACKKGFAIQLSHYGVNRMAMFPDLDGLSEHINWSFTYLSYE